MKILKIELQNINSLKSDKNIVIDFDSEQFKDVGLYAITGSTGAGKTTVLDAITIALYHNVPRFNGTKGSLIDVVSHGAHNAFSRITFENDAIVYEAFWGIKIADKSGKKYKNPKEEVSLKNLTSDTILATQKRLLITEVINVTQLDYNQFLRSVMLAQGEFASFLTAKGPEKGKLLEQITGEQIYKKIGQGILERKAKEEHKLKEIQAKINADDVLTEEATTAMLQEDTALDTSIATNEKDVKTLQGILNWYLKTKKNDDEALELDEKAKSITAYTESHKVNLELLDLNDKATPFKESIQEIDRTEKQIQDKDLHLKALYNDLQLLKPLITKTEEEHTAKIKASETANHEFALWLPKFETITKLDGQLKSETENKAKTLESLSLSKQRIDTLQKEELAFNATIKENALKLKKTEVFLSENEKLTKIAVEVSEWRSDLIILKNQNKSIKEATDVVTQKEKSVSTTTLLLKNDIALLEKKSIEKEAIEKEHLKIKEALITYDLKNLLSKKNRLKESESNWLAFKNISEQTIKATKEQATKNKEKQKHTLDLEIIIKKVKKISDEIKTQEIAVADAIKILDLEKSLVKYEGDRHNLIKGEPCGLCGAIEHPFTENLPKTDVTTSQATVKQREEVLNKQLLLKNELSQKEAALNSTILAINKQLDSIEEELSSFKLKATPFNLGIDLADTENISIELTKVLKAIQLLDADLNKNQVFQKQEDALSEKIKQELTQLNDLKTKVATHKEKIKNLKVDIHTGQKSIEALTQDSKDLENGLVTKLAKFNYALPVVSETIAFIKNIEEAIQQYQEKQKKHSTLSSEGKIIQNNITNLKKELETQQTQQKEYTLTLAKIETQLKETTSKRVTILPLDITAEIKRTQLQDASKIVSQKVELSKIEFQKLKDNKAAKETLELKNHTEKKKLKEALNDITKNFNNQIKDSLFNSKEAVQKALLTEDYKKKFKEYKENIHRNNIKLKTLREENLKEKEVLVKLKDFETPELESKQQLIDLEETAKKLLAKKGEIKEAFRKDKEIRNRNKEVSKKIDLQTSVCDVWRTLFKITGNSKDAFNVYVQRLTLKHLLDLANVHLYKLNKRYSLKMEEVYKPKEELNFNLIDHYQTDQERLVDTSSGGEKFIISLALALGLSDLASKNVKIDSLFIDEGFGTLDKNSLETVISTLETLQSQGKMIGIISHVENLKERIPTQIKITKKSNGISIVDIV